jgi:NADH-quinone oxidoreductase subunit G
MAFAADVDDLTVVTPEGERCRFTVETGPMQDGRPSIQTIRRWL